MDQDTARRIMREVAEQTGSESLRKRLQQTTVDDQIYRDALGTYAEILRRSLGAGPQDRTERARERARALTTEGSRPAVALRPDDAPGDDRFDLIGDRH